MISQVLAVSQGPVSHTTFPSSPPSSGQRPARSPAWLRLAPEQFSCAEISGEGRPGKDVTSLLPSRAVGTLALARP